jgi:Uma2 family endonuclease
VKFEDYAADGVQEYWMAEPDREEIEQYVAREGRYELVAKFTEGTIRSVAIPGFEFPVRAAFDDLANLNALRELLSR